MKKIISFSLYGSDSRYCNGILCNVELAKIIYPDWICRVYYAESVPEYFINELKKQKGWASAMLFSIYYFGDKSYNELAKEIGISKSTVFLNARKVKQHMKGFLNNPFIDED